MKVAIAGTNGLACWIAHYMQQTYHSCTLLSRAPKQHLSARGWNVMVVDYTNEQNLIYNLAGIDLVISMVSGRDQLLLIDAALKAGVSRFAPAEFAGSPENRPFNPILDRGQWHALNRLGQHLEENMQYTVLVCGLLYERFAPDGLAGASMGNVNGANGEGAFLMDIREMRSQIPYDRSGRPAMVCVTSMQDVAQFIVAALDVPNWPRELRMRGERMNASDLVRIAERMRNRRFERAQHSTETLQSSIQLAQSTNNANELLHFHMLMTTANGGFDYSVANLNNMLPGIKPIGFADWLDNAWAGQV